MSSIPEIGLSPVAYIATVGKIYDDFRGGKLESPGRLYKIKQLENIEAGMKVFVEEHLAQGAALEAQLADTRAKLAYLKSLDAPITEVDR